MPDLKLLVHLSETDWTADDVCAFYDALPERWQKRLAVTVLPATDDDPHRRILQLQRDICLLEEQLHDEQIRTDQTRRDLVGLQTCLHQLQHARAAVSQE